MSLFQQLCNWRKVGGDNIPWLVKNSSAPIINLSALAKKSWRRTEIGKETVGSKQVIQFHCFCFEKWTKNQNFWEVVSNQRIKKQLFAQTWFEPKNRETVFSIHWFEPVNQESTFLNHWFETVNQETTFLIRWFESVNQETEILNHWFEPVNQETTFLNPWFETVNQESKILKHCFETRGNYLKTDHGFLFPVHLSFNLDIFNPWAPTGPSKKCCEKFEGLIFGKYRQVKS